MQKIVIDKQDKLDFRSTEAYKTLRTNIQFAGEDIKVISLTSCLPNEGKSSIAMNLSLSLAEDGKKVLLIDADMRKSIMVGRYRIADAENGLSHYLSGQCELTETIGITDKENLCMIVAGPIPPNPTELLGGKRFQLLLKSAKEVYDYIIIDAPPLGSVVDGLIIGKLSDGVAMVVADDAISYKFAQRIKAQLESAECKIIGVILNKVRIKNEGYYNRYYGRYYGRYYKKYYGNYYGTEE